MKRAFMLMAILGSCSTPEAPRHAALMDEIEKRIELPAGAYRIDQYARYYAFDKRGRVAAFYMIPLQPPDPEDKCEELMEDSTSREVPCEPWSNNGYDLPAGQRRWVGRSEKLPFIADGGCSVVRLLFDPATRTFEHIFCHGG